MSTIPTQVVAVFAVIQKDDVYLIARRSLADDQEPGAWFFPGGKVECEEGYGVVESALKREIMEETGLVIGDKMTFLTSLGFIRSSGHHVVALVFLCTWAAGEALPLEDQEEVRWCTKSQLLKLPLPSYTKEIVDMLHV